MKSFFITFAAVLVLGHGLFFCFQRSQAAPPPRSAQLTLLFYSAEGASRFLLVEKKQQKLKLFEQGATLRLLKEYTCATGENFGNKRTAGDSRTPEGIYFITEIYEDKKITVFGSRAFHLDYPNVFDSHAGRQGDGIFIHGTNKKLAPNSTNGCITLDNGDLDDLAPYLEVASLPILILDAESQATFGDSLRLESGSANMQEILAKFPFDTTNIAIANIRSLSYLQLDDQAVISLAYKVVEDQEAQYHEQRRAYLAQNASGKWRTLHAVHRQEAVPILLAQKPLKNGKVIKIVDTPSNEATPPPPLEGAAPPSLTVALAEAKEPEDVPRAIPTISAKNKIQIRKSGTTPPPKSSRPVVAKEGSEPKTEELLAFLEKWRSAWISKDIETYMSCYSPTFKGGDLNKEQWREKKAYLNDKYRFINVKLSDIKVSVTAATATVSFRQSYRSDQLQVSGIKTLRLINRKNRWFIESELM